MALMQVQLTMQQVADAIGLGPRDRALLLKRSVAKEEADDEAVTIGRTNAAALRFWLRMVSTFSTLCLLIHACSTLFRGASNNCWVPMRR